MRFLKLILLCGLSLPGYHLYGQEVTVRTEYPKVVAVGEQVRLSYTVNTSGGDFTAPSFDGFYKLSGPNVSYSMSTQIINGKRTSETFYSYVFYLQATREGKFTIPPARYTRERKEYLSDTVVIEVISNSNASATGKGDVSSKESPASDTEGDMFVRLLLNKREVFAGEPVVATVKFYTRTDIAGLNEIKYPSFNGFLKEEIETPQPTSLERENIDGVIYGTAVFQRFLLYPQRSGELIIDPVQLTVLIRQRSGATDPFFGDFFQSFSNVPRMIASQPQSVKVRPLPQNRPEGFPGAVGRFSITGSADKDSLAVNDALTFRITISGQGNIRLADAPSISFPAGLEVYDPKTTTNTKNQISGTSGSKVFEYLIIPRSAGEYTIPAVDWSYFDPEEVVYRRVSTSPVKFIVSRSVSSQTGPQIFTPSRGEEIQFLGSDIRFIRTDSPPMRKPGQPVISSRAYLSMYGLSLLLFAVIILLRREQVRRNSDRARLMNRRAGRKAIKRLDAAVRHLSSSGTDRFYEETLRALWGYVSDKASLPVSELTATVAAETLIRRGADETLATELIELTGRCEQVRYSPVTAESEPKAVYNNAVRIIRELESQLR